MVARDTKRGAVANHTHHEAQYRRRLWTSVDEVTKTGAAEKVGEAIAKALLAKGIDKVVFDRNGFDYHGRVAAVAQAARDAGLKF